MAGLIDFVVESLFFDKGFNEAETVGGVIDSEVGGIARIGGFDAEYAGEDAMECARPHLAGSLFTHYAGNAVVHFASRFVGEGEGQDLPRHHALRDEIGNLIREHTCLARAGPGYDERRAVAIGHGLPLCFVERRLKIKRHIYNNIGLSARLTAIHTQEEMAGDATVAHCRFLS